MIDVLLADDHELVRTGIKHLLNAQSDIRVIAEASTGEEAILRVKQQKPDVVLMDINMPGMGGIEATSKLARSFPTLKIIILTIHSGHPFPAHLLKAGAMGYLSKGSPADEMIRAVKKVARGERYVSAEVAQGLVLSSLPGSGSSPFDKLSQREMQVMLLIIQGKNIQDISDVFSLSPKTVSTYRYRIYEKLNVENDVELTRLAIRYGISEETK